MELVYATLLLIIATLPSIGCHCPTNEIVQIGDCSLRVHCYKTFQNISLPEHCRGSINRQKAMDLTLTDVNDRFDKNIDTEILNSVVSLTASGNWPRTNLTFLTQMTQLKKLVLARNNIHTIENPSPFFYLENLEHLDLSFNKLTDIVDLLMFDTTNKVKYLSFAHNAITELPGDVFVELTSLRELDLSHNFITNLNEEPFNNLTMLETLNLENNTIISLNGALNTLDNLKHLLLRGNRIRTIDSRSVSLIQQLKTFDISENQLSQLQNSVLLRHWNSLDGVCVIKLSENRIKALSNGTKEISLRYYRNLSENKVMTELDLSKNSIAYVDYHAFQYVLKLVSLDLSHNDLKAFDVNYEDLKYLKILDLSNNQIRSFLPRNYYSMRYLHTLDLSNNNLHHISDYPFRDTKSLVLINLANNKLDRKIILKITMDSNSEKNVLDLSNTGLKEFSLPKESSHVTVLLLNSNNITDVSHINLVTHVLLRSLMLSGNRIEKLDYRSFRLPVSLIVLDLSENMLKEIGPSTFHDLQHLKSLNLARNKLENIEYGTFHGLPTLSDLDLSDNMIKYLDSKHLMDLKSLEVLHLQNNGLKDLDYKNWYGHTYVIKVYMEGNDISCSWLSQALSNFNNRYSKFKPSVEKTRPGPSIEGIPCKPDTTDPKRPAELIKLDKSVSVLEDERLLVLNQRILEVLREQTFYLREMYQQSQNYAKSKDSPRMLMRIRRRY